MRFVDPFRSPEPARAIVAAIRELRDARPPLRVMEVCGTHTMAIARHGIRPLLSGIVALVSGPGCPVCVTPDGYVDAAIAIGRERGALLATFGDMLKVPGSRSSLEHERGRGADVRVVYSPLDAVRLAAENPAREVVFLGVGFETTAPAIAGAIEAAAREGLPNFSVLPSVRTIPGAMALLAADPAVRIEAFLCPAHVTAIIGADAYAPIAHDLRIPCVVAGFEPLDILYGIYMILLQNKEGAARVENEYSRVATAAGNRKALALIGKVFVASDIAWRGIGVLPGSGLAIAPAYARFDAGKRFGVPADASGEPGPCRCGDVLKGIITPKECPLFGTACTPEDPVGPCMVSSEGSCAAWFRFDIA